VPFSGYISFDACVVDQISKGKSEESARKICGSLQAKVEGRKMATVIEQLEVAKAVGGYMMMMDKASGKQLNQLPDSEFAVILSGGSKDESGRTTPRALRKLPIHDAVHVRNALARFNQTGIPDEKRQAAFKRISAAAKKYDVIISDEMRERYM